MISWIPATPATDALAAPTADIADLGASFAVNLAILFLRAVAIAGLASPMLFTWLFW